MPDDIQWPEWLNKARNDFTDIYWATEDIRPRNTFGQPTPKSALNDVLFGLLDNLSKIEQAYLDEGVSEQCEEIFISFLETALSTLRLTQKTVIGNKHKHVDSPVAREIRREVGFLKDLSFLDEKSWPKRVESLREIVALNASDRYIIDILKTIPKVRNHLNS